MKIGGWVKGITIGEILYATTIFLGAFLLFAVQPIAGKHLLPYFGGSSSVWATALVFFTAMLFLGYLYVYILTRFAGKLQPYIHCIVIGISLIPAALSALQWHGLFPSLAWTVGNTAPPALDVLLALTGGIGIPYFLLATTGPLLQYWFSGEYKREPYKLYALSNAASLFALISYPFGIEPHLPLHVQEFLWVIGFAAYAALCAFVCIRLTGKHLQLNHNKAHLTPIRWRRWVEWLALAALPAFLLVATTTLMTQVIAPVPLLWVIPLMVYLITLILAFAGWGRSVFVPALLIVSALLVYMHITPSPFDVLEKLCYDLALLFFTGLACYARLYGLRPEPERLPVFYLYVALGGMVGTFCASILAPLVFDDFWEFPLGVAFAAIFAGAILSTDLFPRILSNSRITLVRIVFACVIAIFLSKIIFVDGGTSAIKSRNFYGSVAVIFSSEATVLMHGSTMHGLQLTGASSTIPTTYYVSTSGVGRAIRYEQSIHENDAISVGVIGLGTGSLAAYCRAGDSYAFYDIDPRIEHIARTYFSYLSHCNGSSVHIGDARLVMSKEIDSGHPAAYDVLAVDAFTDDTIPVHLLTVQAMAIYKAQLRSKNSIIAIHTSNRYLDLPPIILRLAAQSGLSATVVFDDGASSPSGTASEWVLLSQDQTAFRSPVFASGTALPKASDQIWTDDYTSLLPLLQLHW